MIIRNVNSSIHNSTYSQNIAIHISWSLELEDSDLNLLMSQGYRSAEVIGFKKINITCSGNVRRDGGDIPTVRVSLQGSGTKWFEYYSSRDYPPDGYAPLEAGTRRDRLKKMVADMVASYLRSQPPTIYRWMDTPGAFTELLSTNRLQFRQSIV